MPSRSVSSRTLPSVMSAWPLMMLAYLAIKLEDVPRWELLPRSGIGTPFVSCVVRRLLGESSSWCSPWPFPLPVGSRSPFATVCAEESTSGSTVPPARLLGLT